MMSVPNVRKESLPILFEKINGAKLLNFTFDLVRTQYLGTVQPGTGTYHAYIFLVLQMLIDE